MIRSKGTLIVIIACIISVLLNINSLYGQSIRLDEAQSLWVSTKSVTTILKTDAQDVQVPLYSVLLHFWLQLFGTDIIMARFLSLLFFLLTLPFLFTLIEEVSNRKTAILGVILFTLSPFILWYSQEARTYTLLTLITTANHLFFLRFLRSRGKSSNFSFFITTIVGLYTHYFYVFITMSQFLFLCVRFFNASNDSRNTNRSSVILRYSLIMVTVVVAFSPWLIYVIHLGSASNTQPLIPDPSSFNLMQVYANFLFGFQNQFIQSLTISLWPLFLMILFFIFTKRLRISLKRADYFILVSILPVFLNYLISILYKPIFLPRYLILVTPTLFTILAWILMNYSKNIVSIFTGTTVGFMVLSLNFQTQSQTTPVKEDYRDVVNYLNHSVSPHDIVAVTAPFTVYPIEYYYSSLARIDTIPHWNRYMDGPIPKFTLTNLSEQLNTYSEIYNKLYVVLSYDQGYEKDIVNYLDHHYQRLQNLHFSSNIDLRVYQMRYDVPQLEISQSIK